MVWLTLLCIGTLFSSIENIRAVYQSQDEEKVLATLKQLETKVLLSPDEKCYKAVFLCMKADYLLWPNDKLAAFRKGYAELNELIDAYPTNAEYKYHRYMIEKHTPSWLVEVSHMKSDKAFVKATMNSNHPMYSFMLNTLEK